VPVTVGANVAGYSAPTCTTNVASGESIQAAITGASANGVICVLSDYSSTNDTYPLIVDKSGITIAGVGAPSINGGMYVQANNVKITGLEFTGYSFMGSSENAAIYANNNVSGLVVSYNEFNAPVNAKTNTASAFIHQIGGAVNQLTGATFEHNIFDGWHRGVFLSVAKDSVVRYNTFTDNFVGSANDGSQNNLITRNVFSANTAESIGYNGSAENGSGNNGTLTVSENNIAGGAVAQYGSIPLTLTSNWIDGAVTLTGTVNIVTPVLSPYPTN
jgi:parallel beta-helix repeat protein